MLSKSQRNANTVCYNLYVEFKKLNKACSVFKIKIVYILNVHDVSTYLYLYRYGEKTATIEQINITVLSHSTIFVCVCVVRTRRSTVQQISSIQYSIINYTHLAVNQISGTYSTYVTSALHSWANILPLHPTTLLGNHCSIVCFYEFDLLRFHIYK